MRAAQRDYFKSRNERVLILAKDLEGRVDRILAVEERQSNLFEEPGPGERAVAPAVEYDGRAGLMAAIDRSKQQFIEKRGMKADEAQLAAERLHTPVGLR
jgi:hypothetical protein